ncbi:PREDICTED: uncharacterized protein LOC109162425 [Ipomoea nil]|uniref:uncharacterized protein LOC109162425 n=1 Tax=Ipomoea nil TaxID=35883 RepID=UPI0009010A7B|nr:PREDICTED: uncharacterized protein LOC109162425 [Ipomoea nil]
MIAPGRKPRAGVRQGGRTQKGPAEGQKGGADNREGGIQNSRFGPLMIQEDAGEYVEAEEVNIEAEAANGEQPVRNTSELEMEDGATAANGGRERRPNVIANEKQILNEPNGREEPRHREEERPENNRSGSQRRSMRQTDEGCHAQNVSERPGQSRAHRKAAQEEEHVVVRGSKGGLNICTRTVNYDQENGGSLQMNLENSGEHHSDVPESLDEDGDAGAGGRNFQRILKTLLKNHKPDLIGLVEPKVSGDHANDICSKLGFDDWVRVEAIGFSGGIWVLWNKPLDITVEFTHPQFILLQEEGLVDLGFVGPQLTWVRGADANTRKGARLDRALCDMPWRQRFPEAEVRHLPRIASDHAPILIQTTAKGVRPTEFKFRFQAAWMTNDSFSEVVNRAWRSNEDIVQNIQQVQAALTEWNKDVFGNIEAKKRSLLARIGGIQKINTSARHKGLVTLEKNFKQELETTLYQEELKWFQRSREEWIVSGDRNTKFYHAATLMRRSRNKVLSLQNDNGIWITDTEELRNLVQDFYINLFKKDTGTDLSRAVRGFFPVLDEVEWASFQREVTKEEVHAAVTDMSPWKAPGPDGLHAGFYQRTWDTVGDSIFWMVKNAFQSGILPDGVNDTLLTLIPKVGSPETIKQFRPISLCNVSYKIITKTITNRLKAVLPMLVGPCQSSFVSGRQISDNVLIYQEVMHSMRIKKGNTGLMAIKIDLEKAYDRLSWNFINDTLFDAGFNDATSRLIMTCVRTTSLSISWNGSRLPAFKPERGVRQGDAMSPALFVLCMERLSQSITNEVTNGRWTGIQLSPSGPVLSHLCFVDDMVLFSEASVEQNTKPDIARDIESILNIPATTDLGRYLGMTSLHGKVTQATFSGLIDRVTARLEGWRGKLLSFAGRVTLAKSVLGAIPTYSMQTAQLPKGVCNKLEMITRRFIWGGHGDERKVSLVKWDTVTKPKEVGGLGLRSLNSVNSAFMAKLGWRILTERDSLWAQVFRTKYGLGDGRWRADVPRIASNAWRGICSASGILDRGLTKVVRNGWGTRFWMDRWVQGNRLYDFMLRPISLPELYGQVAEYWESGRGWRWERLEGVLDDSWKLKLHAYVVLDDNEARDDWGWSMELDGRFSIKSAYAVTRNLRDDNVDDDWQRIWKLRLPNRVNHFMWLVKQGRLMTNVERSKRGFTTDLFCSSCAGIPENLDHIFRACEAARIWERLIPRRTTQLLQGTDWSTWLSMNVRADKRLGFPEDWPEIFGLTMWWCWRWRNARVFEDSHTSTEQKIAWIRDQHNQTKVAFNTHRAMHVGIQQGECVATWKKPQHGWWKLNVDGCCKGVSRRAGCGGVLLDYQGRWISGVTHNIGTCTAEEAEVWAVLVGLRMAADRQAQNVLVESDSLATIKGIIGCMATGAGSNVMRLCVREAQVFQDIKFIHVMRSGNKVADKLASMALEHGLGTRLVVDPPQYLDDLIWEDRVGARALM